MVEYKVQIESWEPLAEAKNDIFNNEILVSIAQKHNKSVAQVVLRWLIQRDIVAIPKSVRPERIKENIDIFDFELNADDMQAISTLETKTSVVFDHRDPAVAKFVNQHRIGK
ncbi:aldo/keto reductase [Pedobacter helvus]|uniref:Aldo/keto reductase n=1 Tax=Pedobacter helvus TaxID=2563444 RepID=A0ABW9JLD4_9SPHI|nr:aldo/keto reductase [Pedobacter ureilyticus]